MEPDGTSRHGFIWQPLSRDHFCRRLLISRSAHYVVLEVDRLVGLGRFTHGGQRHVKLTASCSELEVIVPIMYVYVD